MRLGMTLLAAGKSARMRRPKLLLPWQNGTVLTYFINLWSRLGAAQIAVLWSDAAPEVAAAAQCIECSTIKNQHPTGDMWSSIQTAAAWPDWKSELTHFAVVLGDQPHVSLETLRAFLEQIEPEQPACWVPEVAGKHCHPVIMHRHCWQRLKEHPGPTLRDFLNAGACPLKSVSMRDKALLEDMDWPEDYERLRGPAHPS